MIVVRVGCIEIGVGECRRPPRRGGSLKEGAEDGNRVYDVLSWRDLVAGSIGGPDMAFSRCALTAAAGARAQMGSAAVMLVRYAVLGEGKAWEGRS